MELRMYASCTFWLILLAVFTLMNGNLLYAAKVEHHGIPVDPDSGHLECLSCHDGTLGHSVESCAENCDPMFNHPVGRSYPPRGKEHEYAPVTALSGKGIRLYKQAVSCISCHNLENAGKNHLAVRFSTLCQSCHFLK